MHVHFRKFAMLAIMALSLLVVGCGTATQSAASDTKTQAKAEEQASQNQGGDVDMKNARLKITVGNKVLYATLEDNATTRALLKKMPMTLTMQNLYGREMCYRFGAGSLPTEHLRSDRYEVGYIVYWAPRGSFVILYKQNGEEFERQQIGHIDSGTDIFNGSGDEKVSFETVK